MTNTMHEFLTKERDRLTAERDALAKENERLRKALDAAEKLANDWQSLWINAHLGASPKNVPIWKAWLNSKGEKAGKL